MKRELMLIMIPLFTAACVLSSCSHKGGGGVAAAPAARAPAPEPNIDHSASIPWALRYSARCGAGPEDSCRGAFGFSVSSNGEYEIGPAAGGQMLSGRLMHADLEALTQLVGRDSFKGGPGALTTETCEPADSADTDDTLGFEYRDLAKGTFRTDGAHFCYAGAASGDAKALHDEVRSLLSKYYPDKFPNPCVDAAMALERVYDSVRHCEKDSDCAYLDDAFLPLEPNGPSSVLDDDCGYIKPLPVANGFEAVAGQLRLMMERDLAQRVCGNESRRPGCEGSSSFDVKAGHPVCLSGICRINPRIGI